MTKSKLYLIPALVFVLGVGQTVVKAQSDVRVGIIGDQTMSNDIAASYGVLAKGTKTLMGERVDAVIHVGDLVESSGSIEQIRAEFAQATGILDGIGKPWHLTPGDHDVNPPVFQPDSKDDSRKRLYFDLYRAHEPNLTTGLWHSFDVRHYHFVSLNSQERLDVDPRWGDVFLSRISEEQLGWLKQDLEAHRRSAGIVVFLHQPLWYNWAWWAPVHALLRSFPVVAVVAGHFHYDQDEGEIDHIRYLVFGATGGSVKHADRASGGVSEVGVLTLHGRKAEIKLLPLDGGGLLQFTPRIEMDRVQALDVVLGELYNFGNDNKLCAKDGGVYGPSGAPAQLVLIPAGNPIDRPLSLSVVAVAGGKFSFDGAQFAAGACQTGSSANECILPASSRVQTSNNSIVVLSNYTPLPPLWQTGVSVKAGSMAQPGDAISLTVKLAFASAGQTHSIEGVATATLSACAAPGK